MPKPPAPKKFDSDAAKASHMARRAKHMTQREAGEEFGKSQSTVSRAAMKSGFSKKGTAK